MEVKIDNQNIYLDNKDIIGNGGEATIWGYKNYAVKIYNDPIPEKGEKLKSFIDMNLSIPDVVTPQNLVWDKKGQNIIGFIMEKFDSIYKEVIYLANKNYCKTHNINLIDIAQTFLNMHKILTRLHSFGIVVGDLNDLNELFASHKVVFIDTDSFQFDNYLCTVGTENYIDPHLYNKDLMTSKVYSPLTDWYSFAVLLFRSLLLVHPYGGIHKNLKNLSDRALKKITVFNNDVIYPKIGRPVEILSGSLLNLFQLYFEKDHRGVFPVQELEDYINTLVQCPNCNEYFPSEKSHCPSCTADNIQLTMQKTISKDYKINELLKVSGNILFTKLMNKKIYLITREGNKTVFYEKHVALDKITRKELFNFIPGARFDIFDNHLVFCPEPRADFPQIMVLDLSNDKIKGVHQTTTEKFANADAVFGCSPDSMFRLANGMLLKGNFTNGLYTEKILSPVMQNQTYIDVSNHDDYVVSYFRIFNKYSWFMISLEGKYEMNLPALEDGEVLLNTSFKYYGNEFLILRQTRKQGIDYVRMDSFIKEKKEPQSNVSRKFKVSEKPYLETCENSSFVKGFIFLPTDSGIVRYDIKNNIETTFDISQNTGHVNNLYCINDNILLITDNSLLQLSFV